MNTKSKNAIQERQTKTTVSLPFRLAGFSAILAGLGSIIIGLFHPLNVLSAVTTASWVNVHIVATAMGFFGMFGLAGLYARQAHKAGWMGLAGFAMYSLWLALTMVFSFLEAFILPSLASELPVYVVGLLGMFSDQPSQINLGILPILWKISGVLYLAGPLLFGIATFRAGILSRWAAGLLAAGSVLTFAGLVLPPERQALVMIPVGLALAWLGYGLLSERREKTSEDVVEPGTAMPEPGKAA